MIGAKILERILQFSSKKIDPLRRSGGLPSRACIALLAVCGASAEAQSQLVTDLQMCGLDPIDSQEMGMTLTSTTLSEIEYFCEFEPAVQFDWAGDVTTTRLGYCSEPGLISPILVTFQFGSYEPGVVTVWWQGFDEPTRFQACR